MQSKRLPIWISDSLPNQLESYYDQQSLTLTRGVAIASYVGDNIEQVSRVEKRLAAIENHKK